MRRVVHFLATAVEVVRIAALAFYVHLTVSRTPLPRLAALLGIAIDLDAVSRAESRVEPLPAWARRRFFLTRAVMRRLPIRNTCLTRSLVTAQRLRPLGPRLRIGVRRSCSVLEAHAWVEIKGIPIEHGSADYLPLAEVVTA